MASRDPERRIAENRIASVRRFNRFYTRQIGVLRKTFLDSPYSLAEARVLYEIASGRSPTASAIGRALDLDAGYLSRVLRNFERRGLIQRKISTSDARQSHLALSPRGRKAYAPLERRSQRATAAMLGRLAPADQARLMASMNTIETLLGGASEVQSPDRESYILRAPVPGDFGWIVKRHAELYAQEYQWTAPFEGLCAQIIADFVNKFDPRCERCWIAEMAGENVGCVFVAKDSPEVARIRLLLVEPKARGLGLGARLTDECIHFARAAGYKKMTLWTHSVLTAARHVYQKAGFKLMRSEKHESWGQPVVSEHWDLELQRDTEL
ncbi:MAG TPA: helix-turn-helix domain-containing GNAT family N-acetyltransferase [Xanthobacteraceae bacterium]|nr:helix-turn-helix domain-containing GNAT family N-acetyltransferase [Xanthobacteraceae bacterium]